MGDEVLTSAGFLATVKEIGWLKEGLVHLVQEPSNGAEGALTSAAARRGRAASPPVPEKGSRWRPGSSGES